MQSDVLNEEKACRPLRRIGIHNSKYQFTNGAKDRKRKGRSRKTSVREDNCTQKDD